MSVLFNDYSKELNAKIKQLGVAWLEEASGEVEAQTKKNTKVDTGKTKGSWEHGVDKDRLEAYVGSRYKNALWEELGTGIYALNGDGRKTKWAYPDPLGRVDKNGKVIFHATVGKKPRRALHYAYSSLKNRIINNARKRFKGI